MTRPLLAAALAALACGASACTSTVFRQPVTLSTRSDALRIVRRLEPVSVERCDTVVVIVPLPSDRADAYEELLAKAQRAGGNAVVDFQVQGTSSTMAPPLFDRYCWRVTGTAAVVDGGAASAAATGLPTHE